MRQEIHRMTAKIRQRILQVVQRAILVVTDRILTRVLPPLERRTFVIGVTEVANNIFMLKKVLPESYAICLRKNPYYPDNVYDFMSRGGRYLGYVCAPFWLARLAHAADAFIYVGSSGFCANREIDFSFLKRKGKKIVALFCGSEIRSPQKLKEYVENKGLDSFIHYMPPGGSKREERVRQLAEMAETYADLIITAAVDQRSYFTRETFPYLYMVDPAGYAPINPGKFRDPGRLRVLHAPTSTVIKGTPLVRAAVKKLKMEGYDFEYLEARRLPHPELIRLMRESHVVLNHFYGFVPGTFGVEALFSYCAVLMSADPEIEPYPEAPAGAWMITRYWEVYDQLKYALDHPDLLEGFARRGHEYALRNYTIAAARKQFHAYCQQAGIFFSC